MMNDARQRVPNASTRWGNYGIWIALAVVAFWFLPEMLQNYVLNVPADAARDATQVPASGVAMGSAGASGTMAAATAAPGAAPTRTDSLRGVERKGTLAGTNVSVAGTGSGAAMEPAGTSPAGVLPPSLPAPSTTANSTSSDKNAAGAPAAHRIFAAGVVEGTSPVVQARFEIPGRIKKLHVAQGSEVQAGTLLAELDADLAILTLFEAEQRLKIAQASRDAVLNGAPLTASVQAGVGRGREAEASRGGLAEGRSASPSVHDRTIAEAQVAIADSAVRQARVMLEKTRLRAPISGVVLTVQPAVGEVVNPTSPEPICTLVDRRQTRVRAFVEELDAASVRVGQRAKIEAVGQGDRKLDGVVVQCALDLHAKSYRHLQPGERTDVRVREVLLDLPDGADLLTGLPVEVFITTRPSDPRR